MPFRLDLASLSLPPQHGSIAVLRPGKDVLRCWPHDYDPAHENPIWSQSVTWPKFLGRNAAPKADCSFEPYAMNYTFDAMFPWIPSGVARDGKAVLFSIDAGRESFERKQQNFYRALAYITHYPTTSNNDLQARLGCSHGLFYEQVVPTIYSIASHISFLDFNLRLWEYNHTETFLERVTLATDGFPVTVCQPSNRFLARLLRSGKYKEYVVKGEYTIALGPGFPIEYCGPHIGVRHDSRLWMENHIRRAKIFKWEYGLGDKAYIGCPELLTEFKGSQLSAARLNWNLTLQHYRGRVEHLIGGLVQSRKTLSTKWRGSFSLLAAIMKICAHMHGLEERMKGPRYDVFGPWPVCPDHIVAAYP